jgi:hypothetical protein
MKWQDFFADVPEEKSYESFEDWYKEIRHLVWPLTLLLILMATVLIVICLY